MVRPRSCWVIYYFDTPAFGRRHQSFNHVNNHINGKISLYLMKKYQIYYFKNILEIYTIKSLLDFFLLV